MKKKYVILFLCLAFVLTGVFLFRSAKISNKETQEQMSKAISLKAKILEPVDIDLTQKYIGYVTPIHEAMVKSFIPGFIEKIYVKGGETVKSGDVLVVLKQDEYIAALKAAYADILKAQALYQNAEAYLKRLQKAKKAVSATEIENAEAQYLSAAAGLEQAKANYATAEVNYDYTLIRAPIDGVVGNVDLTKGNYVSPDGNALLNIVQYNPIRVVFSISDKEYLSELQKEKPFMDEKFSLKLPNGKIFENEGVFQYTDNVVDKTTTSVAVYTDFENIGKILTPNTYVTVLAENKIKDAISVAKNCVLLEDDGNFVYLIRNQKLIKVPVEILAWVNEDFVLKNTFEKGDAIVLENVNPQNVNKSAQISG